MMRWDSNGTAGKYDVLVNDIARAENRSFGGGIFHGGMAGTYGEGGGIGRVGLYVLGEGRVWFDEIYLGPDFSMGAYIHLKCSRWRSWVLLSGVHII